MRTDIPNVVALFRENAPSTVINIVEPLTAMQERGLIHLTVRLENEVKPKEVAAADVLVLCRNADHNFRPIYDLAQRLGIPLIYDLDDHLLLAPPGSHTDQVFRSLKRREMFEWLLRTSSRVRVHSPVLAEVVRAYNPNTRVVWAPVNWTLAPDKLPALSFDPIHIVYAVSPSSGETLYRLMHTDLVAALERFGPRVRLHFLGYQPPEMRGKPHVVFHAFENDYAAFFRAFTHFGYAIGLAPMIDDLFHNCKTNIKYRDYAAAGAAGIYSDTPLYRGNGVVDGETGLLVSGTPGSWLTAISRLVENPELIEHVRQRARADVFARYHIDTVAQMWMEDFAALPKPPPLSDAEQREVEAIRWPFTFERKQDAPWVAALRGFLRDHLPVRWRVRYYDVRHALRRWRQRLQR